MSQQAKSVKGIPKQRVSGLLNIAYDKQGKVRGVMFALSGNLFKEKDTWVSYCRELDLSSCGKTKEEAFKNIRTAIELFFDSCTKRGVLEQALTELGWICVKPDSTLTSCPEPMLPEDVPPAFVIEDLKMRGSEWSAKVSYGQ